VTTAAPPIGLTVRMWLGVTAAPVAVAVELVSGVIFTDAGCKPGGEGLAIDTWVAIVAVVAAAAALLGVLAALSTFRATRDAGEEPPLGRVRFLGVVGITVSSLLLAIIVLSGVGALVVPECVQS
jgi:hypothetical protein